MCIAIPSKVVAVGDSTATVERFGEQLVVSTMMLCEPVELGEYLIIQARSHAVEKMGSAEAQESLALFQELFELPGEVS